MLGAQKMQQRSHINAKTQHTHNVEKNTKNPIMAFRKQNCMHAEGILTNKFVMFTKSCVYTKYCRRFFI